MKDQPQRFFRFLLADNSMKGRKSKNSNGRTFQRMKKKSLSK